MIPKNINEVFKMADIIGNFSLPLFSIMPLVLFIISKVKERKYEKM
jgi:spore germination protein